MSQKSGCEEGLYDEKLQELKLKRTHSFFANYFTRKVRASTLCTSLASRHTRLYVVLNAMCFLIPFVRCSLLLFLTFRWSFLRRAIQIPKTSRKTFKKTMQSTLTKFTAPRGFWSSHISIDCHKSGPLRSGEKTGFNSSCANRRVTCKEAPFGTWFWSRSANKINIQLAVKKERLGKGLADAFTIQKIEHKDVVKLFKRQLINLKRFAEFTDVKLLITCAGVILVQGEHSGVTEIVSKIWRRMNEISKGFFEII